MIAAACIAQPECQFGHLSISFFNTRAMPKDKNTTLHQAEMDCAKHSMLLKQILLSFSAEFLGISGSHTLYRGLSPCCRSANQIELSPEEEAGLMYLA